MNESHNINENIILSFNFVLQNLCNENLLRVNAYKQSDWFDKPLRESISFNYNHKKETKKDSILFTN